MLEGFCSYAFIDSVMLRTVSETNLQTLLMHQIPDIHASEDRRKLMIASSRQSFRFESRAE